MSTLVLLGLKNTAGWCDRRVMNGDGACYSGEHSHMCPLPHRDGDAVNAVCECVFSCLSCVRLFVTLWVVAHQAPLLMGFSRQKYWSGLPCLPPGDLPDPGIKHVYPVLQTDSLPTEPPGKPSKCCLVGWINTVRFVV